MLNLQIIRNRFPGDLTFLAVCLFTSLNCSGMNHFLLVFSAIALIVGPVFTGSAQSCPFTTLEELQTVAEASPAERGPELYKLGFKLVKTSIVQGDSMVWYGKCLKEGLSRSDRIDDYDESVMLHSRSKTINYMTSSWEHFTPIANRISEELSCSQDNKLPGEFVYRNCSDGFDYTVTDAGEEKPGMPQRFRMGVTRP